MQVNVNQQTSTKAKAKVAEYKPYVDTSKLKGWIAELVDEWVKYEVEFKFKAKDE